MAKADLESTRGTQSVGRVMLLLRELASRGHLGWPLGDLAARCGLDKGTAHRILARLKRERMVVQRASDRRYLLGPLVFELGLAMHDRAAFCVACEASLERIARRMNCVSFLCLRSGVDFVCALRKGALPAKALSIEIGTRRPLLASSGGVAILLALPKDEARRVIDENLATLSHTGGVPITSIKRLWRESELRGLGVNEQRLVPGWNAYAFAVRDALERPFASLMLVGEADAFSLARRPEIEQTLQRETKLLGEESARLLPSGYG